MARGKKNTGPAMNMILLGSIVAASVGEGFLYIPASDDAKTLLDSGLIEVNKNMVNDAGEAAARATEKGKQAMSDPSNAGAAGNTEGNAAAASPSTKPTFTIKRRPPAPARAERQGNASVYPFDQLQAPSAEGNDTFFVAATADRPDPAKSLGSTVSSASARYAKEVGEEEYKSGDGTMKKRKKFEYERKFRIYAGEEDGQKGAIVERTK